MSLSDIQSSHNVITVRETDLLLTSILSPCPSDLYCSAVSWMFIWHMSRGVPSYCIKGQIQNSKQRAGLHSVYQPMIKPSMVEIMLCFGFIIIRHFFNASQKIAIYTDVYDIQQHLWNFMEANNTWMACRSLGTSAVEEPSTN